MRIIEGEMQSTNKNIAIIASRFNQSIVDNLIQGALDALKRVGCIDSETIDLIRVPGVLEIPLIMQKIAKQKQYDAIIALGAVIKGETSHFEYIVGSTNSTIQSIAINHDTPVTSGILTTENSQQAIERSGIKMGNKGAEAALAALEMISLSEKISKNNKK